VKLEGEPKGQQRVGTITDGPPGEYIMDRLADEAVKFIAADKDKPFFLNLWSYGVHGPWGHKAEYTKLFANKKDPRGVQGNPIMASMLRSVDECFDRILGELDKLGITDNTIVVFNSDNGGNDHSNTGEGAKEDRKAAKKGDEDDRIGNDWKKWAGNQPPTINTPLRAGKGTLFEGGTRVPLMWRWPGHIKPGTVSDEIVGHIDLYPTLLDLLGMKRRETQKFDGISYASVLKQTAPLERKAFFNYFPHGQSPGKAGGVTARSGDWKLFRWFGALPGDEARYELYNLREDLSETKNLANAQPARVKELDAMIDQFLLETGATYPRPNPAYQEPTAPKVGAKAASNDPLEAWKERGCKATVKDGVLTMTALGKPAAAFLGHGTGTMNAPATVKLRVRSKSGGEGHIDSIPNGAGDPAIVKAMPIKVVAGDWQEVQTEITGDGPLGTLRLYLPSVASPIDIDWVELKPKKGKAQRWEFNAK
jgi:hypothetical protein